MLNNCVVISSQATALVMMAGDHKPFKDYLSTRDVFDRPYNQADR